MAEDGGGQSQSQTGDPPVPDEVVFRDNLSGWVAKPKDERIRSHFYYLLGGTYPGDFGLFSFRSMTPESSDRAVVSQLMRVTAGLDVEIFLTLLERGPADDAPSEGNGRVEEPKTQFVVKQMVDLDGHHHASDYPIDDSQFYQHIGPRPDMSLGPGHFEAAVLLITRDSLAQFFMDLNMARLDDPLGASRSSLSLRLVLKCLADKCVRSDDQGASLIPVLRDLVVRTLNEERKLDYALLTDYGFLPVQDAFLRAKDWDTLEQVVTLTEGRLGVAQPQELGVLVRSGHVSMEDVGKWMLACIVYAKSIRAKCARLCEFFRGLEDTEGKINDEHRQWIMTAFDNEVLQKCQEGRLSFEDGNEVMTLVLRLFELGEATVNYSLLALADKYPAQSSFMIGLLVRLNKAMRSLLLSSVSNPHCPSAKKLFLELAERTIRHLDISKFCTSRNLPLRPLLDYESKMPKKQNVEDALVQLTNSDPAQMLIIEDQHLAEFITALLQQKVGSAMMRQLSFGFIAKAPLIRREDFSTLWLPFLQKLIGALELHKIPLSKPRWGHIFAAIFDAFIIKNRGPKPEVVEWLWKASIMDWVCRCVNCKRLAEFLCFAIDKTQLIGKGTPDDVAHIKHFVLNRVKQKTACEYDVKTQDLVVRKVGSYTEKTEREWAQAAEEVKRQVRRFDEAKLRQILGSEFSSIWNAESLVLPEAPVKLPPMPVLPPEPAPAPVQAAPPPIQPKPHSAVPDPGFALAMSQYPPVYRFQPNVTPAPTPNTFRTEFPGQRSITSYMADQPRSSLPLPNPNPVAAAQPQPRYLTGIDIFIREAMAHIPQQNPGLSGDQLRALCFKPWTKLPLNVQCRYEQKAKRENLTREATDRVASIISQAPLAPPPAPALGQAPATNLPGLRSVVPDVLMRTNPSGPKPPPSSVRPPTTLQKTQIVAPLLSIVGRTPPSTSAAPPPSSAPPRPPVPAAAAAAAAPPRPPSLPASTAPPRPPALPASTARPPPHPLARTTTARRNPSEIIVLDDEDEAPQIHPAKLLPPRPESTSAASSTTSSAKQHVRAPSGSAEAYANYEVEMAPRLRKKYPHLGQDSIKRAMRRSWEKMSDRDRETYKKAAVIVSPNSSFEITEVRPVKIKTEPVASRGKTTPSGSGTSAKTSSPDAVASTSSPLQDTSGNPQRGRTSGVSFGSRFTPYSRSFGLGSGSGLKRKFTGSESSGRENSRPRRSTANGIDAATEAGNLYYPPVRPTASSPVTSTSAFSSTPAVSRSRSAKGGYGAGRSKATATSPASPKRALKIPPMTIDLTLDD